MHGRVCYHPCETSCNRQAVDSAVSIHAVERFLGDKAIQGGWRLPVDEPPSGKRVLVVGAGPSGLSAAYHLARRGHAVEIRDAAPQPGGMMHYGIPAYRLPPEDLLREVRQIEAMGVTIVCNHKVDDVLAEQGTGGFDAVLILSANSPGLHSGYPTSGQRTSDAEVGPDYDDFSSVNKQLTSNSPTVSGLCRHRRACL